MARVVKIRESRHPLADPTERAAFHFAEAERNIVEAGRALSQVADTSEAIRLQTGFLHVANCAMEEIARS